MVKKVMSRHLPIKSGPEGPPLGVHTGHSDFMGSIVSSFFTAGLSGSS